jgi:predicted DsbA family dithiol-disulfide isomerase
MRIDIWSDVVCPWCYIGKRRLETALAAFPHRDEVEVHWHAFELDPTAPDTREGSYDTRLAEKYGCSVEEAAQMTGNMTAVAATEGLEFHFERALPGNTFDAHRLLHLAGEQGNPALQDAVKERLFRATFVEGEPIADREALVRLVAEAGVDAELARTTLAEGTYAAEVRADEQQAQALGITGVPFFVIDNKYGVSGAQPAELLGEVLAKAWQESAPLQMVATGGGQGCEGDNCAV